MSTRNALILAALLAVSSNPAFAGDKVTDLLDDAKVAIREQEFEKAGTALGKAAAAAQKKGDLEAERDVAEALGACLQSGGLLSGDSRVEKTRRVFVAVMAELKPGRAGAYVSAPSLGRVMLYDATATGKLDGVKQASAALTAHAKASKSGRAAPVLAAYGKGMAALADEGTREAVDELSLALSDALAGEWGELALHVGTELAAAHLITRNEEGARDALGQAGTALTYRGKDGSLARLWARLVMTRLPGASETVLSRYAKAMEPYKEVLRSGSAGGQGGRGGAGGITPLGKVFPKLSKKKPIVQVTRTKKGFDIKPLFGGVGPSKQEYAGGVVPWDDGGLHLFFYRSAVALGPLDLQGGMGGRGGGSHPSPEHAYYLLAQGEKWTVTKTGVVKIGR